MTLTPRTHQVEALDGLERTFTSHPRTQLLMACGSGKTYVGAWHAARADARTAVVLTPSLALVHQAASAWLRIHPSARLLVVCADPTTAEGIAERAGGHDTYDDQLDQGPKPGVTTQPAVIARHLDDSTTDRLTLIVGTYHSSPAIAKALHLTDTDATIDLLVLDEAHQLAGRASANFATCLRDSTLPARQRIFMTATPILLGNLADDDSLDDLERLDDNQPLLSMDDESIFGPVAYRLGAGDAIARGLLADYRVLVVAGDRDIDQAALHSLLDAVRRHRVRRILTFHSRVRGAREFAATVQALGDIDGIPIHAEAVDGSMATSKVKAALGRLGDPDASDRVTVVASAQVLREGVDVPAVDAVLFANPRHSSVQIIQAVGRALRLHPDKTHGTIVIPLPLRVDEDDDDQLAASSYGHVWHVLRGLRAHDERVGAELDDLNRRWLLSPHQPKQAPDWLDITGIDPARLEQVIIRTVRGTSGIWDSWYNLLLAEAQRLGSVTRVTTATVVNRRKLGVWMGGQRWMHRRRVLHPDKARRLEQIPGWTWSSSSACDERTLDVLRTLAAATGTVAENPTGPSAYDGLRDGLRRPLGRALATWRHEHRSGTLDPVLVEQLEQLPGWQWEPLNSTDRAGVEALRVFGQWEKHGNVPAGHLEGDVPLGDWVRDVRRRRLAGLVPPALLDELDTCLPLSRGGGSVWSWEHAETLWDLAYDALQQYVRREGAAYPMPVAHIEVVDDVHPVALYQWVSVQRHRRSKGDIPADLIASLDQVPGWLWRAPGVTKPPGEPIDLGSHPHGTAKGAQAKCPCAPCLEYTRKFGRASLAKHKASIHALPVTEAAQHLQTVIDDIARRVAPDRRRFERPPGAVAYAYAADVPVGLIRDLIAGKATVAEPIYLQRIHHLTADHVMALFDGTGSRGRATMSCEQQIPAGPTRARLEDLAARGWHARWVARELGYRQLAVKITGTTCTRRVADQVERLHTRVGTRTAPHRAVNTQLPYLAELEAQDPSPQAKEAI